MEFWCFNPQRGGYKHVRELDFIISTLCKGVNVFILKHLWKTQISPEKSSYIPASNPSVYPSAARKQTESLYYKLETVYKSNSKIFAPEIDRYDFWSK